MAKIVRKFQKVFALLAANNGQFGSAQLGTKVTSSDPDVIQNLPAFDTGWLDATLTALKLPTLEEFQALHYLTTRQLSYILQEGIPEWDTDTEYHQFSIVKETGTYKLYGSKTNDNTGNALSDDSNWLYLGEISNLGGGNMVADGQGYSTHQGVLTPLGTTETIDFDSGNSITVDLGSATGDVTLTLNNPKAGASYIIKVVQGPTTRDIIWPASVKWNGGTPPIISTNNNDIDIIGLWYDGTEYYGSFNQGLA